MVHIDQDPLAPDGVLAGTLDDGTRVSAETLRRVACDCGLLAQGGQRRALDHLHWQTLAFDSSGNPEGTEAARRRLCLPGLHSRPFPARPPHPALAARR